MKTRYRLKNRPSNTLHLKEASGSDKFLSWWIPCFKISDEYAASAAAKGIGGDRLGEKCSSPSTSCCSIHQKSTMKTEPLKKKHNGNARTLFFGSTAYYRIKFTKKEGLTQFSLLQGILQWNWVKDREKCRNIKGSGGSGSVKMAEAATKRRRKRWAS